MTEELKILVKKPQLATLRVQESLGPFSKTDMSLMLNVSRPTLNTRLKEHNWKISELEAITKKLP